MMPPLPIRETSLVESHVGELTAARLKDILKDTIMQRFEQ